MGLPLIDFLLFAADPANGGGDPQMSPLAQFLITWWPFLLVIVLMWFMLFRPQRAEQKKRQEALGALKKNDRVVTIGGIYGVVMSVKKEADEVTLKIDEDTNTKVRVRFGAIAQVISAEPEEKKDNSSK